MPYKTAIVCTLGYLVVQTLTSEGLGVLKPFILEVKV